MVKIVGKIKLEDKKREPKIHKTSIQKRNIETILIHFSTGKDNKIIGRTDKGKIVFPLGERIKNNETWEVEVVKENERSITVNPVIRVKSDRQNSEEAINKLRKHFNNNSGKL